MSFGETHRCEWCPVCLVSDSVVAHCIAFFPPLELLTIQSAEENDFVIKYSPEVWKDTVNVWLGMYYDTNSKYHVTRAMSIA